MIKDKRLDDNNRKFIEMLINNPSDSKKRRETLGISKQEDRRLKKKYFGIYFDRYRLFQKIESKEDLTYAELQFLLQCSRQTLNKYKKKYVTGVRVDYERKGIIL